LHVFHVTIFRHLKEKKKEENSQGYFKSEFLSLLYFLLSIGGVMVSVLATSAVDWGVSPGWVKQDYKIGICRFSTEARIKA
jgi:hypothetical protein